MAWITFPTEEEEERARRFQVNKNYLVAIEEFLQETFGREPENLLAGLRAAQESQPGFSRIQPRNTTRLQDVTRFLGISWASEMQLHLVAEGERAILRYTNVWAPVHAYYAVYMSAQAWFAALDFGNIVDDHSSSLKTISRQVIERQLFPQPWSVSCRGCPHLNECTWASLPNGVDPQAHVELLSNPTIETFWPRYCKILETTRRRRVDHRFDQWRKQNGRKNIRATEKRVIEQKVWPTTIFDVLFRFRVRSNYRDIASFLMSAVSDDWQEEFLRALTVVTTSTCLLTEGLLVASLGPDKYGPILEDFLSHDVGNVEAATEFLEMRKNLVARP